MARTTGSNGKKTAQTIRESSTALFAAHGYAAVSMRMIADAVGVGVSALYNHYPTKQALLNDLLTKHMEGLLAAWDVQNRELTPQKALENFARFHIRYHITKPNEVFLSYMELRSLEPENFKALDQLRRQYEQILIDILAQTSTKDPRIAAMAILGMLTSATTWYKAEGRLSAQDVEDIYADLALKCASSSQKELANV